MKISLGEMLVRSEIVVCICALISVFGGGLLSTPFLMITGLSTLLLAFLTVS